MNEKLEIKMKSTFADIDRAWHKIRGLLRREGIDKDALFDVRLSTEEALVNAVKHGNKMKNELFVDVAVVCGDDRVEISVKDQGAGFDYNNLPDPTVDENAAKLCGRGIYLIRKLMDEVHFNKSGNEITMVKFLN